MINCTELYCLRWLEAEQERSLIGDIDSIGLIIFKLKKYDYVEVLGVTSLYLGEQLPLERLGVNV